MKNNLLLYLLLLFSVTAFSQNIDEKLADSWEYIGIAIQDPGYHVWGSSPIYDETGKVHVFAARWPDTVPFSPGWKTHSEIAHYVADSPTDTFRFSDLVLAPTGKRTWDKMGINNATEKQPKPSIQPNILWIIAEDLSPDLACYGNIAIHTPHLDHLASQGIRFDQVFTTAPVCTPSRTAFAVGMYQTAINAHHMRYPEASRNPLPSNVLPVQELFKRNGYQTVNVKEGKTTGKTDWSFATPFTHFDATKWKEISRDAPFFAIANLPYTHRDFGRDKEKPVANSAVTIPPYYPNHAIVKRDFANYYESIQLLDKEVGKILKQLEVSGLDENTIICFFSDHGRPMTRGKMFNYDSGLHIPLLIYCPPKFRKQLHFPSEKTNNDLISAIDITATSLALAGIDKPEWMQGKVFLGSKKEKERNQIFAAADRIGESHLKSRAVRTKKWKYIKNYQHDLSINELATAYRKAHHPIYHVLNLLKDKNQLTEAQQNLINPLKEEELYDLESDPYEIHNLADQNKAQEQLEVMRQYLNTWQQEIPDYGMQKDKEDLKKHFKEYGERSLKSNKKRIEQLRQKVQADL